MRLILNGQQAFGKAALEKILEAGKDEVVGVLTAPDKDGRPADPVKQALAQSPVSLAPCHCDPLCENFLDDGQRTNPVLDHWGDLRVFPPK